MTNQATFETEGIVKLYASAEQLQKPEETILSILGDRLKNMAMLDLGVGGGRTTAHFAHRVHEYVAVDYAHNMIEACKRKFPALAAHQAFKVCDARSMPMFTDRAFDFILFSFNGLDYLSHEDRIKALREIKRLGKPGGYFCFSSHNLNSDIEHSCRIAWTPNPVKLAYRVGRYGLFKLVTRNVKAVRRRSDFAVINDGAHHFRSRTYYIKPQAQIDQLTGLGFTNIRLFSLSDGRELTDRSAMATSTDSWLYYLCGI